MTKTALLKQMEELIEEPGLTCCICREGYKFQVGGGAGEGAASGSIGAPWESGGLSEGEQRCPFKAQSCQWVAFTPPSPRASCGGADLSVGAG